MGIEFKMNGDWFPETPETFEELQSFAKEDPGIWEAICDPRQNGWRGMLDAFRSHGEECRSKMLEQIFPRSPDVNWKMAAKLLDASEAEIGSIYEVVKEELAAVHEKVVIEQHERDAKECFEESLRNGTCLATSICRIMTLPGGAEMEMIYCPPGEFMMGSPIEEEGRNWREKHHAVKLTKGFWLGKYPVTQKQWQSVVGGNPSHFKERDDLPVDSVSWHDCKEFVQLVNAQLRCEARLPTEAEWEYACRAGTESPYGGTGVLDDMGWYAGNSSGKTHPVGQKRRNAWGFFDMHGNVEEWCNDYLADDPSVDWGALEHGIGQFVLTSILSKVSGCVVDPQGPARGDFRVLRGGCWYLSKGSSRSAERGWAWPEKRFYTQGFRLCCSVGYIL